MKTIAFIAALLLFHVVATFGALAPVPALRKSTNRIRQNAGKLEVCGAHLGQNGFIRDLSCGTNNLLLDSVNFANLGSISNAQANLYVEPIILTRDGVWEFADFHGRQPNTAAATAKGAIEPSNDCFTFFFQRIPDSAFGAAAITRCDLRLSYTRTSSAPFQTTSVTQIAVVEKRQMKIENKGQTYFADSLTYFFEGQGFPHMFPGQPNEGQYINYLDISTFAIANGNARHQNGAGDGGGAGAPSAAAVADIQIASRHRPNTGRIGTAAVVANTPFATLNAMNAGLNQVFITSANKALQSTAVSDILSGVPEADGGDDATDKIVKCLIYYSTDSMIKCRRGPNTNNIGGGALTATNDDDDLYIDATLLVGGDDIALVGVITAGADTITVPTNGIFGTVIQKIIPTIVPSVISGVNKVTINQNADEITIKGKNFFPEHIDTYFVRFGFEAAGAAPCDSTAGALSFHPLQYATNQKAARETRVMASPTAGFDGGHAAGIALDFGFWGSFTKAAVPKVCQPVRINDKGTELVCKLLLSFPVCHAEGCQNGAATDGCAGALPAGAANLVAQIHMGFQSSSHTQTQEIGVVQYVEPKVDASAHKISYADVIEVTITGQGFDINHYQFNQMPLQLHDGTNTDRSGYCGEAQRTTVNPLGVLTRDLTLPVIRGDVGIANNIADITPTTGAALSVERMLSTASQCRESSPTNANTQYHQDDALSRSGGSTRCAALDRTGTRMICHFAAPIAANKPAVDLTKEPELQLLPSFTAGGRAYGSFVISSSNAYYRSAETAARYGTWHAFGTAKPGIAALMSYALKTPTFTLVNWATGFTAPGGAAGTVGVYQGRVKQDIVEHRGAVAVITHTVVGGDPHFFGLMGESFFFNGKVGNAYSILSDANIQVNGKLQHYRFGMGNPATVFRSVGVKFGNNRILFDAGANYVRGKSANVMVNSVELAPNATATHHFGSDEKLTWKEVSTTTKNVNLKQFDHKVVAIAELTVSNYQFQFAMIEEGKGEDGKWFTQPIRFVDFSVKPAHGRVEPHGILGQKALNNAKRSVGEHFEIEGEAADYEVSDIFSHDSKFNKFDS